MDLNAVADATSDGEALKQGSVAPGLAPWVSGRLGIDGRYDVGRTHREGIFHGIGGHLVAQVIVTPLDRVLGQACAVAHAVGQQEDVVVDLGRFDTDELDLRLDRGRGPSGGRARARAASAS